METDATLIRKGARRMCDVSLEVRARLASGETESVNLMEWLVTDMSALATSIARQLPAGELADVMMAMADRIRGEPLTRRLSIVGKAISDTTQPLDGAHFLLLRHHHSDLVRQWACYAVNERYVDAPLAQHLEHARPFASDRNMSVREIAWIAFRPRLRRELAEGLRLLEGLAADADPNQRRFAVEVTRPRSVWGAHLDALKRDPAMAISILQQVRSDPSRYVQLAAGNWLNDAAKTRGDWVIAICERWMADGPSVSTRHIVRRALRTLKSRESVSPGLFPTWPATLDIA